MKIYLYIICFCILFLVGGCVARPDSSKPINFTPCAPPAINIDGNNLMALAVMYQEGKLQLAQEKLEHSTDESERKLLRQEISQRQDILKTFDGSYLITGY